MLPQDLRADRASRKKQVDAAKEKYRWSTEVRGIC